MEIFAVYDQKAQAFTTPFFDRTQETAQRAFAALVNNPESDFGRWPEDYTLFHLGSYDNETGVIRGLEPPRGIAAASTLVRVPQLRVVDDGSEERIEEVQ